MKIKIGFSPCPNDTFIFDAWYHKKIELPSDLEFEWHIEDVEALNIKGEELQLDVTKVSFHNYALLQENYQLLRSGSALGHNCGPLLVSKRQFANSEISDLKVAIPGKRTTANFLLSIAFPELRDKVELVFSDIEDAVINDRCDAGLIIHENRFTYHDKGLRKIIDLGEFWESNFHVPIPLGGIMVNRGLPTRVKNKIGKLMYQSVNYAFENPDESYKFMKKYAQTMKKEVMDKHVNLYVNDYTLELGEGGIEAINTFMNQHKELNFIEEIVQPIFI